VVALRKAEQWIETMGLRKAAVLQRGEADH